MKKQMANQTRQPTPGERLGSNRTPLARRGCAPRYAEALTQSGRLKVAMLRRCFPALLLLLILAPRGRTQASDFTYITISGAAIEITGYTGPGGDVTIPTTLDGLVVSSISQNAFSGLTNLTSIAVPGSVTNLGNAAFASCSNLTSVTFPDGLTNVGSHLFQFCTSLPHILLPGIAEIGDFDFAGCVSLTNITVPATVHYIGYLAFAGCSKLAGVFFQGNAPNLPLPSIYTDNTFLGDTNTTAYYLPGTLGWGATLGMPPVPAVLWNPYILTLDSGFGVREGGFGFNISGTANIPIVVEASTNLAVQVWVPLQSCTLTNGSVHFSDPQWTNYPNRFYRIRSP